jgi:AcrR family transcriptional regulator
MVENPLGSREVGRPRTFQDDDVFLATARVLSRLGARRLTLEAVAREVGCTKQALIGRFGSKRALIRAYLAWDDAVVAERFRAVRRTHDSPLAALRARFALPAEERPDEVIDAVGYANVLVFYLEAGSDPELRELFARHVRVFETEIAALLRHAQEAGELRGCDPPAVAHHLMMAMTGASTMWAADPRGSVVDRISEAVEVILRPYLVG